VKKPVQCLQAAIKQKLEQINRLTISIETLVGLPLEGRIWPLLSNSRLILLTDDPHLATQARLMHKTLLKYVNHQHNLKLVALDIKVMSLPLASNERKSDRTKLSPQTAGVICSIAASIEDRELSAALTRLAASGRVTQTPAKT